MQKFIRIMAIIAVALVGLSLFLLLTTIPFQRMIADGVFGCPDVALDRLPMFPLVPFLNCFLRLGCMALLIICCGNRRGGIWLELIVFVSLVAVLPAVSQGVSLVYNQLVGRMGDYHLVANTMVSNISNYCLAPAGWGQAIAYAVCGMSIVFKRMSKEQRD